MFSSSDAALNATDGARLDPATPFDRPESFRLESYFQGDTLGHGVIHDRFGRLIGEATAEMTGYWRDEAFILEELFRYADGRVQERIWTVQVEGERRYSITAPEMVGGGTGLAQGHGLRMKYRLRLPVGGRNLVLSFDDRMYLQGQDVVINTNTARKFGVVLARISFAFQRV